MPLALDTVWSPLHWNLLRMAYQPCHIVELAVLPTLTARAGEEPPAFAERTATDLANELGIAATPHTTEEKRARDEEAQEGGPGEGAARGAGGGAAGGLVGEYRMRRYGVVA